MQSLQGLTDNISRSQAVNNLFFDTWTTKQLTMDKFAIFARNYWEWTFCFPEVVAAIISNTKDVKTRIEYTKILFSEMGYGDQRAVHSTLFENFCNELAKQAGCPGFLNIENLKNNIPLLDETRELINWQKQIYLDQGIAAGAQLALEWQAYTMISQLYEGARNYKTLWADNPDGFHEACEFFYAHIGEAEKHHKDESLNAAQQLVADGVSIDSIKEGFNKNLELIGNFWNAIAKAI